MSASAITEAARAMLQAAVPEGLVEIRPPRVPSADLGKGVVIYLYHDGSHDVKITNGQTRRHHFLLFRLLIATGADDMEAERMLLGLHDRVTDAFTATGTARTLNGAVPTAELRQRDGKNGEAARYARAFEGENAPEWLSRWWTLEAQEQLAFSPST